MSLLSDVPPLKHHSLPYLLSVKREQSERAGLLFFISIMALVVAFLIFAERSSFDTHTATTTEAR